MKSRVLLSLLLVGTVFIVACQDIPPTQPSGSHLYNSQPPAVTNTPNSSPVPNSTPPIFLFLLPSPTPNSACQILGTEDPSSQIAWTQLPQKGFFGNSVGLATVTILGAPTIQSYSTIAVYAGNSSNTAAGNLDVAFYDNDQRVADSAISIPPSTAGWFTTSAPVTINFATDSVIFAVHSLSNDIYIGTTSVVAEFSSGITSAFRMPTIYPGTFAVTPPTLEMFLTSCP